MIPTGVSAHRAGPPWRACRELLGTMAASNFNGNGRAHGRPPKGDCSSLIDRLPPQNLEAEQGVLGSILLDNEVIHDVVSTLKVEDFYRDTHQTIYRAIRDLYDLGKPIDGLTLSHE